MRLGLRLRDGRIGASQPYVYRLDWANELSITRDSAPATGAVETDDSSTWIGIFYHGVALDEVRVEGDGADVRRLVGAFTGWTASRP